MTEKIRVLRRIVLRFSAPEWALAAALIILFFPILFGGQAIFWGLPMTQFYPWHYLARQDLLAGHLPLWNPMLGMGAPLLANAQSALLYPPNGLYLILPIDLGMGWMIVAHLLLAGAGMIRLCRKLGIGALGQTVGGLAFMLSGYLAARGWFLTIVAAAAWLPWIILAGEDAWKRGRWFSIPLAFLLALQWLAGHWQTAWYTALLLTGWLFFRALAARPVWRSLLRAVSLAAGAAGLAFALAAAQILPTVEYWLASQRAGGVDLTTAGTYSFWPWDLIRLVAPGFFGSPVAGNYWGYANFWEDALYIGILPLALAVVAVIRRLRREAKPDVPYGYLLLILPVVFLIGMGTWTPVFEFLYRHIPTFDFFQAPVRILILAVFVLALFAAAGAEEWARDPGKTSRAPFFALVFSLAAVAAGAAADFVPGMRHSSFGGSVLVAGVFFSLASALWIWKSRLPAANPAWRAALILIVAVDVCIAARGLIPSTNVSLYRNGNPDAMQTRDALAGRRIYMPEDIRYRLMYSRFFRFDTFQAADDWMDARRLGLPNLTALDGIPSANNFDSFVPARIATLLERIAELPAEHRDSLMEMMGIGAVWEETAANADPALRILPAGAQRAWGVCRARWALDGESALREILDPAFDPRSTAILEAGAGDEGATCRAEMRVEIPPQGDPNALRVDVDFGQDGFLVLADANYPGWEVFVDGERTPLLQADYAFRAVRVPAGEHKVEFLYNTLSFRAGAALTGITVFLLTIGSTAMFLRRRRNHHVPSEVGHD